MRHAGEFTPIKGQPDWWRDASGAVYVAPAGATAQKLADSLNAPAPDNKRQELKEAITAKRWAVETGGVTLPNGVRVNTGKDDQARITSVVANAGLAGVESVDFKAEGGWVSLTVAEIKGIAAAVALHVQACFSAERMHHEAIAALPDSALGAYDINQGWPDA